MSVVPSTEQIDIATDLGVTAEFDAAHEVERRVSFLVDQLESSGLQALVLGISGGVDSAAAAGLCRLAVARRREQGAEAQYVAMRLPYGRQLDEADAQLVLDATKPDTVLTVDVQPASDAMLASLVAAGLQFADPHQQDFVLGNIKARQRMIAQYAVAGTVRGIVVGTDQASEAITGFYTKYGDGGVDITPLTGLTKRRVREVARLVGVPERIVTKEPTADLLGLKPQRPDEEELGLNYEDIDDFLEGRPVATEVHDALVHRYRITAHKRAMPTTPPA